MEYDLMKDQKICLFLIQRLPIPDLCRLIIDYKNYLETQDNYIYHISLWENISSRFFISCETKFPTYSYILNGEHYIANKDRNLEYYNYTQISYQVRNMIRDDMSLNDQAFFYHSNCDIPGIYGIMTINSNAYPDHTAFNKKAKYYDPKSNKEKPTWLMVDVKYK